MSRSFTNDQTLIDRLTLNDTEAFEELYRRYWYSIYVYCLKKLHSSDDAKKVVRNTFVAIWENRHRLPSSFSLSKHLYEEVRKDVIKFLSQKLANKNDNDFSEKDIIAEFSAVSLQAARIPVTNKYAVLNKPSELIRQQTGQIGTEHYSTFSTLKGMFQEFTAKLSVYNFLPILKTGTYEN